MNPRISWNWIFGVLQPALFRSGSWCGALWLASRLAAGAAGSEIEVGLAVRDVTPAGPIWLAGYAARTRASDKVDSPLLTEAVAFRSSTNVPVVLVSLDNCEVSREFTRPV